jgi:endonuclease/exonuclease/phosphatase family metal-dependent hydrolase
MKIKVMSYNVLHGFRNFDPPFDLEKDRLEAVQKVVRAEKPDVLGITEACFGSPSQFGIFMDYARLFNFQYFKYCPSKREWGSALLSQYPISNARAVANENGSGIEAEILKEGGVVNVGLVHPRFDATENEKIKYVKAFLAKQKKRQIILGDFNAISDKDTYDRATLIREYRKFDSDAEHSVDKYLERKLIPYLRSRGLIDALQSVNSHKPTIPTKGYGYAKTNMRIDFIFHTLDLRVIDAKTIKNKMTDMASDHYPIVTTFDIK